MIGIESDKKFELVYERISSIAFFRVRQGSNHE